MILFHVFEVEVGGQDASCSRDIDIFVHRILVEFHASEKANRASGRTNPLCMRNPINAYRDMCPDKMRNITVRVDEETYRDIEKTASIEKINRSTATRQLLRKGIIEEKKKRALDLYRAGKCTLWKAAQQADLNIREMMDLAAREKIPVHITPEDVDEAWREALDE
ncbi:MAG: UPF0175 family protein [Deltaproteobacteria bacterium]|nr:UPF0175 family protein [Deltaproteobacteria bacterium]